MDATPINLPDHAFLAPMSTDSPRIPHRASTGYKRDSVNRPLAAKISKNQAAFSLGYWYPPPPPFYFPIILYPNISYLSNMLPHRPNFHQFIRYISHIPKCFIYCHMAGICSFLPTMTGNNTLIELHKKLCK